MGCLQHDAVRAKQKSLVSRVLILDASAEICGCAPWFRAACKHPRIRRGQLSCKSLTCPLPLNPEVIQSILHAGNVGLAHCKHSSRITACTSAVGIRHWTGHNPDRYGPGLLVMPLPQRRTVTCGSKLGGVGRFRGFSRGRRRVSWRSRPSRRPLEGLAVFRGMELGHARLLVRVPTTRLGRSLWQVHQLQRRLEPGRGIGRGVDRQFAASCDYRRHGNESEVAMYGGSPKQDQIRKLLTQTDQPVESMSFELC